VEHHPAKSPEPPLLAHMLPSHKQAKQPVNLRKMAKRLRAVERLTDDMRMRLAELAAIIERGTGEL